MQLSAVCAAATVSAQPGRQTEGGCSLRLTRLTPGQSHATNKAEANQEHAAMLTMLLCLLETGNMSVVVGQDVLISKQFEKSSRPVNQTNNAAESSRG